MRQAASEWRMGVMCSYFRTLIRILAALFLDVLARDPSEEGVTVVQSIYIFIPELCVHKTIIYKIQYENTGPAIASIKKKTQD